MRQASLAEPVGGVFDRHEERGGAAQRPLKTGVEQEMAGDASALAVGGEFDGVEIVGVKAAAMARLELRGHAHRSGARDLLRQPARTGNRQARVWHL